MLLKKNLLEQAFRIAYNEAKQAFLQDEVPVGACVIYQDKIISKARNQIIRKKDPTAHAELLALQKACKKLESERIPNAVLVTTLEPCVLCTGAIVFARIAEVHALAKDSKLPAMRRLLRMKGHNHYPKVYFYDKKEFPAGDLLKEFFRRKREKIQNNPHPNCMD